MINMKVLNRIFFNLGFVFLIYGCSVSHTKKDVVISDDGIVLIVGGGSSHDYDRYYKDQDRAVINKIPGMTAVYTDRTDSIPFYLAQTKLLILTNNQSLTKEGQTAVEKYISLGKPIILLHASNWYNWKDWPWYNLEIVGGGSKSHEKFQEFRNVVINPTHPITKGLSSEFNFKDELYRYAPDLGSKGIEVLVIGQSLKTGAIYPVVFTVHHSDSKIVGITLGHDFNSHDHPDYQNLLTNAVVWALSK